MSNSAIPFTLCALAFASGLSAQRPLPCKDPTPDTPLWWQITWTPNPDGSSTGTIPDPPALPKNLDLTKWAGRYDLLAVATGGTYHHDTIMGTVLLRSPADTVRARVPLVGYADSSIAWPKYLTFAHSPALRGRAGNGVETLYDRQRGGITVVFGNGGLNATDSGVLFEVFGIDSTSMFGRWVDGGLGVLIDSAGQELGHPQGFFCLHRVEQ